MSLLDRISSVFRRPEAAALRSDVRTTIDEMPRRSDVMAIAARLQGDSERVAMIKTCREMYKLDSRARGILLKLSRDVVRGGLVVSVPDSDEMAESARDLLKRLGMKVFGDYYRLTERDGDSFIEVGVGEDNLIHELSRKPTLKVHRNSNDQDKFSDPSMAYWFHPMGDIYTDPPADAIWFSEWQIVHARANHDEGDQYGTPMFGAATGPYKRIREGELDMAIRRRTRAGMRYHHVIDGATEVEIEDYKRRNAGALSDKFAAVADFFSSKSGSITAVQGDAQLGDIKDIRHHIATWWLSSPVPMALMGYAEDLNRDVLEEQTAEYRAALDTLSDWLGTQIIEPLLQRQWLLDGFYFPAYPYELQWGSKTDLAPETLTKAATAIREMASLGLLSSETLLNILARFLPDFDPQAEIEAVAAEREQQQLQLAMSLPPDLDRLGQAVREARLAAFESRRAPFAGV